MKLLFFLDKEIKDFLEHEYFDNKLTIEKLLDYIYQDLLLRNLDIVEGTNSSWARSTVYAFRMKIHYSTVCYDFTAPEEEIKINFPVGKVLYTYFTSLKREGGEYDEFRKLHKEIIDAQY